MVANQHSAAMNWLAGTVREFLVRVSALEKSKSTDPHQDNSRDGAWSNCKQTIHIADLITCPTVSFRDDAVVHEASQPNLQHLPEKRTDDLLKLLSSPQMSFILDVPTVRFNIPQTVSDNQSIEHVPTDTRVTTQVEMRSSANCTTSGCQAQQIINKCPSDSFLQDVASCDSDVRNAFHQSQRALSTSCGVSIVSDFDAIDSGKTEACFEARASSKPLVAFQCEDEEEEPKPPRNAYQLFVQAIRPTMPGNVCEVATNLSRLWSKMSPLEKRAYEEEATELKLAYDSALDKYKKSTSYTDKIAQLRARGIHC